MRRHTYSVGLFVLLLPLCGAGAASNDRAAQEVADATCATIIDRFSQAIAQTRMMEIEVTLHQQIDRDDKVVSLPPLRYRVLVGDGALLRIEPVGVRADDPLHQQLQSMSAVSDGDELLLLDARHHRYMTQRASDTWQGVLADLGTSPLGGLQQLAFLLMFVIPNEDFVEVREAIDEEQTEQDGRVFQRCRFQIAGKDQVRPDAPKPERNDHWLIWFEDGDLPIPRRMEYRHGLSNRSSIVAYTLIFDEWRFSLDLDVERFAIETPEDAVLVSSHTQLLMPAAHEPLARPEALLDKPAPDVRLRNRDGRQATLNELLRDKIVILNFWATWSPPSVQLIPDLIAIEKEFADRDVVFYAINMRQTPQRVEEFLNRQEWNDLKVAFDRAGNAAARYVVHGIPHTVIIDREGIVRHVHTGYAADLRARLRRALATIIADEDPHDGQD